MRPLLILASLVVFSGPADAATVRRVGTLSGLEIVAIEGEITDGDDEKFRALPAPDPNAVARMVFLDSPGGNLRASLSIGAQIREKEYLTGVLKTATCASACALIWLGSERRYMDDGSKIGFHAAYVGAGKKKRESGVGNALVGAYLNTLGLPLEAIEYITTPPPDDVQWLTMRDALGLGINVLTIPPAASPTTSAPTITREDAEMEAARKAGVRFRDAYRNEGLIGLNTVVDHCYREAIKPGTGQNLVLQYCYTIDLLTSDVDRAMAKRMNSTPNPRNTPLEVNQRVRDAFDVAGVPATGRAKLLANWSRLSDLVMIELAEDAKKRATAPPGIPKAGGSPSTKGQPLQLGR